MTVSMESVQSMTKHASTAFAAGARADASDMASSSLEDLFFLRADCCLGGKNLKVAELQFPVFVSFSEIKPFS